MKQQMAMMEATGRGQGDFVTSATKIREDLQAFEDFREGVDTAGRALEAEEDN